MCYVFVGRECHRRRGWHALQIVRRGRDGTDGIRRAARTSQGDRARQATDGDDRNGIDGLVSRRDGLRCGRSRNGEVAHGNHYGARGRAGAEAAVSAVERRNDVLAGRGEGQRATSG